MPGLNEIIDAHARVQWNHGKRISGYSKMKRAWGETIKNLAYAQRVARIDEPSHFTYCFIEKDKRRDPSNFIAGGVKLIEDGLQEAGLLENDGWKQVLTITPHWGVTGYPGVCVFIGDRPVLRSEFWTVSEVS